LYGLELGRTGAGAYNVGSRTACLCSFYLCQLGCVFVGVNLFVCLLEQAQLMLTTGSTRLAVSRGQ